MEHPLCVGVDIHRTTNYVHCLDPSGQTVTSFQLPNNRPGTQQFAARLAALLQTGVFDGIRLAGEATSVYWLPFFAQLSSDPTLADWPLELYADNPRVSARYRDIFADVDKSDPDDAELLADHVRTTRKPPHPFTLDAQALALRTLTRCRFRLTQQLALTKLQAGSLIYLKASAYTAVPHAPFGQTFSTTSLAVLQAFASLDELLAWSLEDLAAWIDAKGRHNFADPQGTARKLQVVARTSYQLPAPLLAAVNLALSQHLQLVQYLERQRTQLDHAIAEALADRPNPLSSIPGVGPVYAAGILAEIGGYPAGVIRRFDGDQAKVAKFAGFKWRKRQSGEHESEETPLTRRGNAYVRYYLCEAANLVRLHDEEYAAYYEKKYREVPKHRHKRAVTLTARKLVRLVVRLLTTNQAYQKRRTTSEHTTAGRYRAPARRQRQP